METRKRWGGFGLGMPKNPFPRKETPWKRWKRRFAPHEMVYTSFRSFLPSAVLVGDSAAGGFRFCVNPYIVLSSYTTIKHSDMFYPLSGSFVAHCASFPIANKCLVC